MKRFLSVLVLVLTLSSSLFAQTPKIEYIAHAAFILESSQGTRVIIDPYHSYKQMGFTFPEAIAADAVLITHPHYDHDGSQYFSKNTPIYRDVGRYQINDIQFYGISSKHSFAEQIGKSGNQNYNTIWVVELDGVRIAHLGDNGVPSAEEVSLLQDVDYIIGHPQDAYYSLFTDKTYIPNHYLLPEVTKHTNWMKPVAGWLEGKSDVSKLESNSYTPTVKDTAGKILVFQPSPLVQEWSQDYYDALAAISAGYASYKETENLEEAVAFMDKAITLAPFVMDGYYSKAVLLSRKQENTKLISVLEHAFSAVPDVDWGTEAKARILLARAYAATANTTLAYNHYRWLHRHQRIANTNDLKEAQEYITTFEAKD